MAQQIPPQRGVVLPLRLSLVRNRIALLAIACTLVFTILLALIFSYSPTQAQNTQDSDNLAKFVALMQYLRSDPTPADVNDNPDALLTALDTALSRIYITGFIAPFTGETDAQVNARLQSIPAEDKFIAVMVESYRLAEDPLLLNVLHTALADYYVEAFTSKERSDATEFLKRAGIVSLANAFDSTNYSIPAPSMTRTPDRSSSPNKAQDIDSINLAKFVALMQYLRSDPTPADVNDNPDVLLTALDTALSRIYITGFIAPFTGETDTEVNARLQSILAEDKFTAVMVESYRLAADPLLLNVLHTALADYYVEAFTSKERSDATEFLKRVEIVSLANAFNPADYAIPAPSVAQTPATPTATPTATLVATGTPTIAQLVKNVESGVVQIVALTGSGSGFVIDTDGRVVTNQHVVGGNRSVTVRMHDGMEHHASVLGVDPVADLAVVDIAASGNFTPVALGDSSRVQVGEEVIAIGYPLGFQLGQSQTVTRGIISARRPNLEGTGVEHFQTDAAINPGNSGGPLFNRAGQVIGVNTSKQQYTSDGRPVDNIAFAVSINELKSRLTTLKGSGSPQPVTTPTPVPTPVTPVPTPSVAPTPPSLRAGWERYNNGVYGFSIDIPPSWTLNEDTEDLDFANFSAPDNKAGFSVEAYDLPTSYSLQAFAEWNRDYWTDKARDESWNVFSITSFTKKRENGKEFYELAYRYQSTDEFCVERVTERIYLSAWYPGKPHGYIISAGVCELHLSRYPSATTNAIQNSFTEWLPYWNPTHAWGLNAAPGWILDEETNRENYSAFWTSDQAGVFEIVAQEVYPQTTLEDFKDWRVSVLRNYADTWETFDGGLIYGIGGREGARDEYIVTYRGRSEAQYCISNKVELIVLSSFHPEHEYGFLVVTGVCEESLNYDRYDDERWEMIYSFRY